MFLVAVASMAVFARSPFGAALRGTRDQARRMTALGYNVWLIRFLAILFSGFWSGIAGLLFIYYNQFIGPQVVALTTSAEALLMVISGGSGTLLGPIVGAAIVVIMKNVVSAYIERWNLVLGVIFILIISFMPEGLVPGSVRLWRAGWRRVRGQTPRSHRHVSHAKLEARGLTPSQPGARAMTALAVSALDKSFGGLRVTAKVDLVVEPGERRLIIGPNGAGKTTLFNLITGEIAPDSGSIALFGRDITRMASRRRAHLGMARTYQIITLFPHDTILRNVTLALLGLSPLRWNAFLDLDSQRHLSEQAREALGKVGLEAIAERPLAQTSYGERRRVEIAMALAQNPKVLLLDEPFAGLSIDERREVQKLLGRHPARGHRGHDRAQHGCGPRPRRPHHAPAFRRGHRRGDARPSGRRSAHAGGLPWHMRPSGSPASTPSMATATCCRACRSLPAKAACWASSAATARGNRPA